MSDRAAQIYALCDEVGSVWYVGKSVNPARRLADHLRDSRNGQDRPLHRWIRSLECDPTLRILEEVRIGSWESAEAYWIRHFRSANPDLCNLTPGGEGVDSATATRTNTGRFVSEETKGKIRASLEEHFRSNGTDRCGRYQREPHHYQAFLEKSRRLNQAQVDEIRRRRSEGEPSKSLAEAFNISSSHVDDIVAYRRWSK